MNLADVCKEFEGDAAEIRDCFLAPVPKGTTYDTSCLLPHAYSVEICVIRLYCSWQNYCRQLVLISAYGEPLSLTGAQVPRVLASEAAAIKTVKDYSRKTTGRAYEPNWADANKCMKAAQHLGIANFSRVAAAIGSTPSPAEDLRAIRDYYAHRNDETLRKVLPLPHLGGRNIIDLPDILRQPTRAGVSLFEDWILTLSIIGRNAAEYP